MTGETYLSEIVLTVKWSKWTISDHYSASPDLVLRDFSYQR